MLTGPASAPALAAVITVIAPVVAPERVLTLHLPLETGYVPVTKVFTQLLNFFQLEQMNPQDLDGADHLKRQHLIGPNLMSQYY